MNREQEKRLFWESVAKKHNWKSKKIFVQFWYDIETGLILDSVSCDILKQDCYIPTTKIEREEFE
jgi:hypothetical protein